MALRPIALYGTLEPPAKRRILRAGLLEATFEAGNLRKIRYAGVEIIRGLAFLLRDASWGTYATVLSDLKIKATDDAFVIRYSARAADAEQALSFVATIEGKANGSLTFTATGTPETDFRTNRTGFVILHPLAGVVGQPVAVRHKDGTQSDATFPAFISPRQPIFDIRTLRHSPAKGVDVEITMGPDTFEMEDHRNWLDASYKTYVRSLREPWPYVLKKGEPFTQTIAVKAASKARRGTTKAGAAAEIRFGSGQGIMPSIGLEAPQSEMRAGLAAARLLADMPVQQIVGTLDGRSATLASETRALAELHKASGKALLLEIILPAVGSADTEMQAVAEAARAAGLEADAVLVNLFHDLQSFQPGDKRPPGSDEAAISAAARAHFPKARLGGGMMAFFTELNRKRCSKGLYDFVSHSICPTVHAADDASVMETLESLASTGASLRAFMGDTPYHIGPSGIAPRFNPYGPQRTPADGSRRLCLAENDPRQRGLFGAAFAVGLIQQAAEAGAVSIAPAATTGLRGVFYRKDLLAQPGFDGTDAQVYPIYHVLAITGTAAGQKRLAIQSSDTDLAAIGWLSGRRKSALLANLTAEPKIVSIDGLGAEARLSVMDARRFETAIRSTQQMGKARKARLDAPLMLDAYAVVRIET
jgi:D-apionolactonase